MTDKWTPDHTRAFFKMWARYQISHNPRWQKMASQFAVKFVTEVYLKKKLDMLYHLERLWDEPKTLREKLWRLCLECPPPVTKTKLQALAEEKLPHHPRSIRQALKGAEYKSVPD